MIKHIVMWRLKEEAAGKTKAENLLKLKSLLEELTDKIPEIRELEVGVDFSGSDAAYDVALYSVFAQKQDLETYQKHPEHVKVADFINQVRLERVVVDYEV
ncbi:MAG: Dabb family protein [Candidatus Cyclobacteriaceae bacterium M3_2C_046]